MPHPRYSSTRHLHMPTTCCAFPSVAHKPSVRRRRKSHGQRPATVSTIRMPRAPLPP